jgi:hypothetical protein
MDVDKLVLTHRGALLHKYGSAGVHSIEKALLALVAADLRRGISTVVLHLDLAQDMARFGGALTPPADAASLKKAIDRIAKLVAPHYWLLLGGPDILPLVPLRNPAYSAQDGDGDKTVPSDLPYACDAPYSTNPNRFLGPTRVLGRLPDEPGARRPTLLTRLIRASARNKPRPRSDYDASFGITAQAWQASTALSMNTLFGPAHALHEVPAEGPAWTAAQLRPRMHFINCHGADASPQYFGQPAGQEAFPVAHEARRLRNKVSAGTVVAAECCYGAQLYDPAEAGGQSGIALAYLEDGAAAFFGSTTIAYGPSEGNASADLICQYFLLQVMAGASTGRAALEARQQFAAARTHLDPYDLKTLMQFYLLGDPSVHPVAVSGHALTRTASFKKAFATTKDRSVRGLRRERLLRDGAHLGKALPALNLSQAPVPSGVESTLRAMAGQSGLNVKHCARLSFQVTPRARSATGPARHIHVVKGTLSAPDDATGVTRVVALVATEENGELLHVRRLHSR